MLDVLVEILDVPETLPFDAWRFIGRKFHLGIYCYI
jgi:hypothetical protein